MSRDAAALPKPVVVAPLMPPALAVMAGIVIDRFASPWGTRVWGMLALTLVIAIVLGGRRRDWSWMGLLVASFAALGGGWHHLCWSDLPPDHLARGMREAEAPRPAWVRGVLIEVAEPRAGDGVRDQGSTRALLDVSGVSDGSRWRSASGRVQLNISGEVTALEAGDAVEAAGSLARVAGPLNPGEFDYREYLRAQGVRLRMSVESPEGVWRVADRSFRIWPRVLGRVRGWSYRRLVAGLDSRAAPLAAALLLGRREAVDPEVNDAFARTGTTHLLAISGLHLQVLAAVLLVVMRALGVGRRAAFSTVAIATAAYALLVGLMPSVVRSAAMTLTVCLACWFDRPTRPANVLAMAALATLALNPSNLFDVGGQLSFLAIAVIIWGVRPAGEWLRFGFYAITFRYQQPGSPLDALERKLEPWWRAMTRKRLGVIFEGITVSLVVWLVAVPLVALRFHIVSPIGVLLNIPLIPITSLALLASGLALGLSAVWAPLGVPAARLCSLLLHWTEAVVGWGASRSWGHTFVPGPPWWWVSLFYGLLGLASAAGVGRWRQRSWLWGGFVAWLALGTFLTLRPQRPAVLEADVLAVGHGLAVVIQDRDGTVTLYDCGRMRDPSVGRRIVAPALWSRAVRRVDTVILSHADADHYDGLPDVLDRFSIGVVRVPPGFGGPANPGAEQLLADVQRRQIPIRPIVASETWASASATFRVRHPPAGWHPAASDNARSVVVEVESRGRRFLLTGDLELEGLAALTKQSAPSFDAFLAPHHGGRSANPERLYQWAEPGLVVVSQRPPTAGSADPLAWMDERGVPLLRTWQRGAITLRWSRTGLRARGFLDDG